MQAVSPYKEAAEIVLEEGGDPLKLCYQCGLCSGTCPWNMVRSFIVRRMMHEAQLGLIDFEAEEDWMCTTCRACVEVCPREVGIIDVMRAMRRAIVGLGIGPVPDSLRLTMKNISAMGNPLGEEREKRAEWAKAANVKEIGSDTEMLYFSCCVTAYEPRGNKIAQATAKVLQRAGIDFGIIGADESCCGESVRKAGNESLFQTLAQGNISTFNSKGVKKVLTTSPHCYYTFKNEYPGLGAKLEVIHIVELLAQLIEEGKLKPTKEIKKKVAYHDPCYLGRHSGVYDAPRQVLQSIPGVEIVEMRNTRNNSLCCGGGGGRIWMETPKGERFSDLRIEQAIESGAEVLATACPYCISNFEDSVLTEGKGDVLEVKDIVELVLEAI